VTAQLTESSRAATGMAVAVLGVSYLIRAAGDAAASRLGWLSPLAWPIRLRAFAGEQWWVLALTAALTLALAAGAYALAGRRDLGAGLLPQRPGPAEASPALRGTFSLAWRLQRGLLAGWIAGMVLWGATLGGAAGGIGDAIVTNHAITDMLTRLGGRKGIADAFLAAVIGITGLVVAAYAVQATLRLRGEESAGRLEPLLATPAGRIRWALGHLAFALLGTAALLAVAGATAGLAYGLSSGDPGGQVVRLTGSALVQVPAAWVLAGVGTALFGLAPRFTALAWAALGACALVLELGALLGLNGWLLDISPFWHVPKLPGSPLSTAPVAWLIAVAAALTAVGLAGFRRRDVG
jgi:ABC-2 type transport system permease protein